MSPLNAIRVLGGSMNCACEAKMANLFAFVMSFQTPQLTVPLPVSPDFCQGIAAPHRLPCKPSSLWIQSISEWTDGRLLRNIRCLQFLARTPKGDVSVADLI